MQEGAHAIPFLCRIAFFEIGEPEEAFEARVIVN
jgi:hypothetical protein